MLSWLLPVFLFAVWWLWVMACAAQTAVEDIRRNTPKDSRRGVSIFPVFPIFPLFFWATAVALNQWFQPWGTLFIGGLHVVFAILLFVTIIRDIRFCRSHDT